MNHQINIGTSGWSYSHWQNIFYPESVKPLQYLEFYTQHFSCVELNSCFYHLPRASVVEGWLSRTPDKFRFCPKISRYITHELKLAGTEESLAKFFGIFEGLVPKLGPVLIQLPPGLDYNEGLIKSFTGILEERFGIFRYAVEIRNRSWLNDSFLTLLDDKKIAFVIADSGRRYPYCEAVTSDIVYIRFHGREQLYASDYNDEVLFSYAGKIEGWAREGRTVWAFFNNDFHGYAVRNAMRLREILSSKLSI